MKLIYLSIALLSLIAHSQNGWMGVSENTIPFDKQMHFTGGGFIGLSSYHVAYSINGGNRKKSKFWGIVAPIIIGTIKELSDTRKGGTGFDVIDLGYTAVGGVVGTYTADLLVGFDKRKA